MSRRVVYTCLFGFSEQFTNVKYARDAHTDFVCFTDDKNLRSDFWDVRFVGTSLLDPARHSKRYKALPHIYLSDYDESLYIDNTVFITAEIGLIFGLMEPEPAPSIIAFPHPWRRCVYAEAEEVRRASYDTPAVLNEQMDYYRSLGFPENNGLHAAGMLLRRHRDALLAAAMQEWHSQILRYSKRDQLSFEVVAWRLGLKIGDFPGSLTENALMKWPYPANMVRVPRDFEDARYLQLHPDVARAGVNPRQHYLHHGHKEQRQYK